ncbi:hypothetical protein NOR_07362 [Metarhizium rileyi]|uniref:Heat-labile enterotoxin IIA, A chain n=1 Tax=Metarhizium rileyi (strain RCEF 4871) TaxID=1649241 RepID=A0A166YF87_METRR|nr:hypothetical protein NOR_07362 [Metarhizium rileyi RCEF 4871]
MKASSFCLFCLAGLSAAGSVGSGGASHRSCLGEKPSVGTQVPSTIHITNDIKSRSPLESEGSLFEPVGIVAETPDSLDSLMEDAENNILEGPRAPSLPKGVLRRQTEDDDYPGQATGIKIRESEDLPELAAEALLKLQNFPPQRQTRSLAVLDFILPVGKPLVQRLGAWAGPIGLAARTLDDAVKSFQECIGGRDVPEIHGNELKLRILCYLRGEQQHMNHVDMACRRLHGKDQTRAIEQENKLRSLLGQIFDNCTIAIKSNQDQDLLRLCDDLSRQTLDLNEAVEKLVTFRNQLQQKIQAGNQVEKDDVIKAARLIRQGSFGIPRSTDESWAKEMAAWYMQDLITSSKRRQPEPPGCYVPPAWVTKSSVKASDIPRDRIAGLEAFYIVSNGPFPEIYKAHAQFRGDETCLSAQGFRDAQPVQWDILSAALLYVNKKFAVWQVACKACRFEGSGEWQLRCGSTKS